MTVRKTPADIARVRHANQLNAGLAGTGIYVTAESRGGYAVTVQRLKRDEVEPLLARLMDLTGREPGEV